MQVKSCPDYFLNYKEMVKEFENLTQLNRFEKLNKSKKIIDIVYNAENKLWIVTFNVKK